MSRQISVVRCGTVWAVATAAAAGFTAWSAPAVAGAVTAPPPSHDVAAWLVLACGVVALVATGWLWCLVTLLVRDLLRGAGPRRSVPAVVSRLVLAACGVGLAGALVGPAHAAPPPPDPPSTAGSGAPALGGLPLPDRATSEQPDRSTPARPASPAGRPGSERTGRPVPVRVAPGDTLWDLAAGQLPASATDAEVDRRWRAVHAANREVIGDDPDLILPGQRLVLPERSTDDESAPPPA